MAKHRYSLKPHRFSVRFSFTGRTGSIAENVFLKRMSQDNLILIGQRFNQIWAFDLTAPVAKIDQAVRDSSGKFIVKIFDRWHEASCKLHFGLRWAIGLVQELK